MTRNPVSLKQFEESATSWLHRLRTDLFVRTEFLVVAIFLLLCLTNIIIIVVALEQLHIDVAAAVITILSGAIATKGVSATTTSAEILDSVKEISDTNITIVVAISLIVAVVFGYIATRVALVPTRTGLTAQKKFISNIAHELRTPLSIIRANSEILLLQKGMRPDSSTLIKSNVEELDRVSAIIDNLLTLNTFRHTNAMNFEAVNLSEVIRDSISKLETLTVSKKLSVNTSLDDSITIWGNRNALAQIAMQLIKNALIFTPPSGSIFISTFFSHHFASLEVRDTGIGIKPEDLGKVFEPFYQVEASRSQNKGTGGLGLAIVSELVKFHQGKISIRSMPDVGTVIQVDLPAHHSEEPDRSDKGTSEKETNEIMLDFSKKST